ncbi:hypothetical protein [Pseudonocardia xinjiangensis]|uniref:Flp pilus-assembly TadE/G-like protein n=1 Tax=Pseudonocardia xinjiangensis TaxID=75289 RepID=A0ABX1RQR5_9PSEU|nr:hypothetical protein [Pseudonocardia xinjiangensis]NMH81578.1 hypothetical protein [Pseudonocardia xinjiangensis]
MQRESGSGPRMGGSLPGVCLALLAVLAALLMIPIGLVAYPAYRAQSWAADVAAVVEAVELSEAAGRGYSSVRFAPPLPAEALDAAATGDLVAEIPADVRVGERVICRVRQTFTMDTDFDRGAQTSIERCWR